MPIGVEVTSAARFAEWVASKGGHMPGAKPAAAPAAGAPAEAQPQPAIQQPATAN
jgi:cytochrome c oxidase subunit 2